MQEVITSQRQAYAAGTFSNLHTQFRSYLAYCVHFGRTPLPADLDTVCGYAQFLSRTLRPGSISNYLSGVRTLHAFLGVAYDFSDDFHLKLLIKGIRRTHPYVPHRATPVTPQILLQFYHNMDHTSSLHKTVWSCCLILFFTLSRLGSVLPSSSRCQDTDAILTRDRINFSSEGLVVTLLRTKTIQFGRRRLHIPLLKLGSVLCPVQAYKNSLRMLGQAQSSIIPAFVFRDNATLRHLTKRLFIRTFRAVVTQFVVGDARFTGHSFRRGGATWAFQSGVPGELIQVMGDWSSDSYKQYLEFSMENKLKLAALFSHSLTQV
jgi:integrase